MFNRSHSVAYAVNCVQSAYLKNYYPVEYMAALISSCMFSSDSSDDLTTNKVMRYVEESKRMGIDFLPIDINHSDYHFIAEGKSIRIGFGTINGVGKNGIHIWKERKDHGEFKDLYDFCNRLSSSVLNKKVLLGLVYSGSLDELARKTTIQNQFLQQKLYMGTQINYHILLEIMFEILNREDFSRDILLGLKDDQLLYQTLYDRYHKYIKNDRKILEIQLYYLKKHFTGFCIDTFPLFEANKGKWTNKPLKETFKDYAMITEVRKIVSKKNNVVYFLTVEAASGKYNVTCFEDVYEKNNLKLHYGNIVELELYPTLYQRKYSFSIKQVKYYRIEDVAVLGSDEVL